MGQTERLLAALSVLLVFIYLVLRAIYVPTFHDEAATFFHYIVPGKFLPYHAHWDANNHILNSMLAYYGYRLFGTELIWIRLPNVLAFLIYGFYAFRIAATLENPLVRGMAFLALITAAFPLEFFSQARGYGMSLAFLCGAVYHGFSFLKYGKPKHQLLLWFWCFLAVSANLALTNTILIFVGLVFLKVALTKDDRTANVSAWFIGVLILGAASYYGFELKDRGLLYTGFPDGFVKVTVYSLLRHQFGVHSMVLAWAIAAIGFLSSVFLSVRLVRTKMQWSLGRLSAVLLLLNAIGSILLNLLLGMNFPEDRVGVYYFPLFIITVAAAIDELQKKSARVRFAALTFAVFPVHLTSMLNLNTTLLWPPWHVAEGTYDAALDIQQHEGRQMTVSAHYLNELGWAFWNFRNDAAMQPLQRKPVPDTLADLIIARPKDFAMDSVPYHTVYRDAPNGVFLLQRNKFIQWKRSESPQPKLTQIDGTDEFYEFYNDTVAVLPARYGLFEMKATVTADPEMFDGHLVIIGQDSVGDLIVYDYVPFHWIRPKWQKQPFHIKRTFHFPPEVVHFKVYLWNINRSKVQVKVDDIGFSIPAIVASKE